MDIEDILKTGMILDFVWLVLLFFVPFMMISIMNSTKATRRAVEDMLAIQMKGISDADLPDSVLMRKHKIKEDHTGIYFFDGKYHKGKDAVLAAIRAKDAEQQPAPSS